MSAPQSAFGVENDACSGTNSEGSQNQLSSNTSFTSTKSNTPDKLLEGEKRGEVRKERENGNADIKVHTATTGSVGKNEVLGRQDKLTCAVDSGPASISAAPCLESKAVHSVERCVQGNQLMSPPTVFPTAGISGLKESKPAEMPHVADARIYSAGANPIQSPPDYNEKRMDVTSKEESHVHSAKPPAAPGLNTVSSLQKRSTQEKPSNHHPLKRPRPSSLPPGVTEQSLNINAPRTKISPTKTLNRTSANLRRGKWTAEEEAYVAQVIHDFNAGFLNAPAGTTLRSYLSDKLQCDPMRITKKFTGADCIGKRVFHPAVRSASNAAVIDKAQLELDGLERRWRKRLEIQQKESAKKAAAAAASGRQNYSSDSLFTTPHGVPLSAFQVQNSTIATMAKWLDRANTVLANDTENLESSQDVDAAESLPANMVEIQLKEVEELIGLGPKIQQTFAGLPKLFKDSPSLVSVGESSTASHAVDDHLLSLHDSSKRGNTTVKDATMEPHKNRPCLAPGSASTQKVAPTMEPSVADAKDAEALVGFLNSVRSQNQSPDRSQNQSPDEKSTKQADA